MRPAFQVFLLDRKTKIPEKRGNEAGLRTLASLEYTVSTMIALERAAPRRSAAF